ncbi:hypothetical protein, partial [Rahnella sp. PD4]|uniref:hypothetical protein n=1 Tax=Rahnella sp. PD4 TaxID=3368611 RepID=UPI003BA1F5AB
MKSLNKHSVKVLSLVILSILSSGSYADSGYINTGVTPSWSGSTSGANVSPGTSIDITSHNNASSMDATVQRDGAGIPSGATVPAGTSIDITPHNNAGSMDATVQRDGAGIPSG